MNDQTTINIAISVLVLAFLLTRQLTVRTLRERSVVAPILVLIGVLESAQFFSAHHPGAGDVALLGLSLVIGCALGAVRALWTVRLWVQDGRVLRQGGAVTAVLWVVGMAQHLAVDEVVLPGLGTATILFYFGVVLLVQQVVLVTRARRTVIAAPVR